MRNTKVFTKPLLTSIFLGLGGFLYGFDSGIITPSLALKSFQSHFGNPNEAVQGSIVSVYQAGGLLLIFYVLRNSVSSGELTMRCSVVRQCLGGYHQ